MIYVLTKKPIDVAHAASSLASTSKESLEDRKAVVVMYDVAYAHQAGKLQPLAGFLSICARLLTALSSSCRGYPC